MEGVALRVRIHPGAVFQAYPYSNPDDMLQSVKVTWGRAAAPGESTGDYAEQIRRMALQLLLEHRTASNRRSSNRRLGHAA